MGEPIEPEYSESAPTPDAVEGEYSESAPAAAAVEAAYGHSADDPVAVEAAYGHTVDDPVVVEAAYGHSLNPPDAIEGAYAESAPAGARVISKYNPVRRDAGFLSMSPDVARFACGGARRATEDLALSGDNWTVAARFRFDEALTAGQATAGYLFGAGQGSSAGSNDPTGILVGVYESMLRWAVAIGGAFEVQQSSALSNPTEEKVAVWRKTGRIVQIFDEDFAELLDTVVSADEIDWSSPTGKEAVIAGAYRGSDGTLIGQWQGLIFELYVFRRALTDAEIAEGLVPMRSRLRRDDIVAAKVSSNPVLSPDPSDEEDFQRWPTLLKINDSDFDLIYEGAITGFDELHMRVAHSVDGLSFVRGDVDLVTVNGVLTQNGIIDACGAGDVIEDPSDATQWLVLAFLSGDTAGSANGIYLFTVPKDYSTAGTEIKKIIDSTSGAGGFGENIEAMAMMPLSDGRMRVFADYGQNDDLRRLRVWESSTTDLTGTWVDMGDQPEFSHALEGRQSYALRVEKFGDLHAALLSYYSFDGLSRNDSVYEIGLYLSDDWGAHWQLITNDLLSVGASGSWDDGVIYPSRPVELKDGRLAIAYNGGADLHDNAPAGAIGIAHVAAADWGRARQLVVSSSNLTGPAGLTKNLNTTGLVSRWRLDELNASDNALDEISSHDLSPSGAGGATNLPQPSLNLSAELFRRQYRSRAFDGTDDAFSAADHADFEPAAFTVAAWTWQVSFGDFRTLLAKYTAADTQWAVMIAQTSGKVRVVLGGTAFNSTGVLSAYTWHHVAVSWDGAEIITYIDGEEAGRLSAGVPSSIPSGAAPIELGRRITDGLYATNGNIADVRFYSRALAAAEVSSIAAGDA